MQKIQLTTEDNITIVGDYYENTEEDAPAVILLHMMPSTKESWRDFAPLLIDKGFQVLAIDERGHGESTQGGTLDYQEFSNEEQQKKILDVIAAREMFREKGVELANIFVGGASIGANLAIQYMAENHEARAGFALSPGYNYKGIEALDLADEMHSGQYIYLAAAKDDERVPDSWRAVEELAKTGEAEKEYRIFETGGHGTDIFVKHPDFPRMLADWLAKFI